MIIIIELCRQRDEEEATQSEPTLDGNSWQECPLPELVFSLLLISQRETGTDHALISVISLWEIGSESRTESERR